ncbi:MAG: ATP-binding protein [Gaiellaceae bacterium]
MRPLSLVGRVSVLAAAVALAVGVMSVAALLAILSLRQTDAQEASSRDVTVAALRLENVSVDLDSSLRGYALSGSPRFLTLFQVARGRLPDAIGQLQRLVADDPAQRVRAQAAAGELRSYVSDYAEPVIEIARISRSDARGPAAGGEDKRRTAQIRSSLDRILAVEDSRSAARAAHVHAVTRAAVFTGIGALALSAALVLLFGAWVARRVARPVRGATAAAARVAAGDFSIRLDERAAGEIGSLVAAFNAMARALDLGRRELLVQNRRLRESEQHKRDLISMVSHELRTPLASVVGFTSLLLERTFDPKEQRRYLEIVDAQARRLAALAGDFLDVQLLEGGAMPLDRAPLDLADLTAEQAQLYFSHSESHRLDLDLPGEPVIVDGDRDRLAQVLGNLFSNALKYASGGEVRVRVQAEGDDATVSVSDDGMGIAEREREKVFEKFFRGSDAAGSIGGTGLGLAVAREIVASHGGTISVVSEPGEGSTFTVSLPLAVGSRAEQSV